MVLKTNLFPCLEKNKIGVEDKLISLFGKEQDWC